MHGRLPEEASWSQTRSRSCGVVVRGERTRADAGIYSRSLGSGDGCAGRRCGSRHGEWRPFAPNAGKIRRREHDTCFVDGGVTDRPTLPTSSDAGSVRQETTGGDDREPRITAEMVDDWLRHARLRAANLFYLADDPAPGHRDRALREMTQALREALEEVRVVADELRRSGTTDNVINRAR